MNEKMLRFYGSCVSCCVSRCPQHLCTFGGRLLKINSCWASYFIANGRQLGHPVQTQVSENSLVVWSRPQLWSRRFAILWLCHASAWIGVCFSGRPACIGRSVWVSMAKAWPFAVDSGRSWRLYRSEIPMRRSVWVRSSLVL